MRFYVGLHQPSDGFRVQAHGLHIMISINRLIRRRSDFCSGHWMLDSGGFTAIERHGDHQLSVSEYSDHIERWRQCGVLDAAVAQDYMCEPFMLERTGMTVPEHQALTIDRYIQLKQKVSTYVMPVLQGYQPAEYRRHLINYGALLEHCSWVGVGSVCKRNTSTHDIRLVLHTIKKQRPDLRLHGFGLKTTALRDGVIRQYLYSADSAAWSYAARQQRRNANDWREAVNFGERINGRGQSHDLAL